MIHEDLQVCYYLDPTHHEVVLKTKSNYKRAKFVKVFTCRISIKVISGHLSDLSGPAYGNKANIWC